MLREQFLGRNPSHFIKTDPIVKAHIVSESFLWSAWNFTTPIFAVFATQNIQGGTVATAASAFSVYLISRVVFELVGGKYASKSSDKKKMQVSIVGLILIAFSYLGFAFAHTITEVFLFYAVTGAGLGIASPAKNSLFSIHLDKNKETIEWGVSDAVVFICMALAASLGGFVAVAYGFKILFLLAFFVNLLAVLPYLFFLRSHKQTPQPQT